MKLQSKSPEMRMRAWRIPICMTQDPFAHDTAHICIKHKATFFQSRVHSRHVQLKICYDPYSQSRMIWTSIRVHPTGPLACALTNIYAILDGCLKSRLWGKCETFEQSHEIMVLFVLRKFILQTRMRSHPVGLDVWFLVEPFVYFHSACVRTAKALAGRLCDKYHNLICLLPRLLVTTGYWDMHLLGPSGI